MQYYTGQKLDMESITKHAVDLGIPVGWDLAHAVGRIIYLIYILAAISFLTYLINIISIYCTYQLNYICLLYFQKIMVAPLPSRDFVLRGSEDLPPLLSLNFDFLGGRVSFLAGQGLVS